MVLEAGVKFIADLTSAYVEAIRGAVNKIVDAFQAFVDWAIEFIESTIDALFAPIIDAVQDAVNDYCYGVLNALMNMYSSYEQSQTISDELLNRFGDALHGTLFWVVFGLTLAIDLVLIALKVITNVWGFLLDIAVGLVVGVIIDQVFRAGDFGRSETASTSGVDDGGHYNIVNFRNSLESQGVDTDGDESESSKWATFWSTIGIAVSVFDLKLGYAIWTDSSYAKMGKIGLTLSGISLALSSFANLLSTDENLKFWGTAVNIISVIICAGATTVSFVEFMKAKNAINAIAFISSTATSLVALGGLLNIQIETTELPNHAPLTVGQGGRAYVG